MLNKYLLTLLMCKNIDFEIDKKNSQADDQALHQIRIYKLLIIYFRNNFIIIVTDFKLCDL